MICIVSPAKSLNFDNYIASDSNTLPVFLKESQRLVNQLKKKSPKSISKLMSISDNLSELNYQRFQNWGIGHESGEIKQAIYAFQGDVYLGLEAGKFSDDTMKYADDHFRMLSGLYGVLRPMDIIHPYRLEMGTKLTVGKHKNLYSYWGAKIAKKLNEVGVERNESILLNLASNEYFKSVDKKALKLDIWTPVFKDQKNGNYKVISFFAKRARGMMARFVLEHKINELEQLQAFDLEGYYFDAVDEKKQEIIFLRD